VAIGEGDSTWKGKPPVQALAKKSDRKSIRSADGGVQMSLLGSSGFKVKPALFVVCLWLMVGLGLALLPKSATPSRNEAESTKAIYLDLEPGSPYADLHPRAEIVSDFSKLPPMSHGVSIVAASHFEPSGAQFPNGLHVIWQLDSERKPGSTLWIVDLDPDTHQWICTGDRAIVGATGRLATGTVYHLSDMALTSGEIPKE
jgi:hypothetical protein